MNKCSDCKKEFESVSGVHYCDTCLDKLRQSLGVV